MIEVGADTRVRRNTLFISFEPEFENTPKDFVPLRPGLGVAAKRVRKEYHIFFSYFYVKESRMLLPLDGVYLFHPTAYIKASADISEYTHPDYVRWLCENRSLHL